MSDRPTRDDLLDEIDRLTAELQSTKAAQERAEAERDEARKWWGVMQDIADAAQQRLESAESRAEKAEANAARYRWLRDRKHASNRWPHITQWPHCEQIDKQKVLQVFDNDGYHPERLDAAIDRAITQKERP